jgi:hypothetical protein
MNMETLKVYPGIEKGTVEYYYKKYHLHQMVKQTRRPFTVFYCMNKADEDEGGLTCLQHYISLNPGAKPQKYVSTYIASMSYSDPLMERQYID